MPVLSVSIEESSAQIVAGIPVFVILETNIPATIFYTLDGSEPTTASDVFTDSLTLSTELSSITLKAFATNGVLTSPVITQTYTSSIIENRTPRDKITGLDTKVTGGYPFASNTQRGNPRYGNIAGLVVDDPSIDGTPYAFDGAGGVAAETDVPVDELDLIFSKTNRLGEVGRGIGTLESIGTVILPKPIQESSVPSQGSAETNSAFFNPRALVVFQDSTEEPYDPETTVVNRPYFGLANKQRTRSGQLLYTSASEGNIITGTFVKQYYNPRDGTITYYYRDSDTNRWIISKTNYAPKNSNIGNYARILFGRDKPTAKVFKWYPLGRGARVPGV